MKLRIYKFSLVVLVLLIGGVALKASPLSKEFTKVIIKEFPLSPDQAVRINNQYGLVNVESWDQNVVKIKIEIVVDTDSESSAEEIYKMIGFGFEESDEGVTCTTNIESRNSGFWSWFGGAKSSEYSINYDVKMPAAAHLAVTNKYGDCTVSNLTNSVEYNIKYGNLHQFGRMRSIDINLGYGKGKLDGAEEVQASLEYCTIKFGSVENADLNSKYSNVYLEDAGAVVCNTKYDDYQIGTVGSLKNSGKYDDFEIEEVAELTISTMYADLQIGRLYRMADLRFKYGEVKILELMDSFEKISMEGSYADFSINTTQVSNFTVDINGDYTDVQCNRPLSEVNEVKDGSSYSLVGRVKDSAVAGAITARLSYGSVKIK